MLFMALHDSSMCLSCGDLMLYFNTDDMILYYILRIS